MLALRICLGVGVLGVGIGAGYAIPLSSQHDNLHKASPKEYDTRTTLEIYNELLGNSAKSIKPQSANSIINIILQSHTIKPSLIPNVEEATIAELAEYNGVTQSILGTLPNIGLIGKTTAIPSGNTIGLTTGNQAQGTRPGLNKRRSFFKAARNVGTEALARSDSRLSTAKSKIRQRTIRKHVALRVNPQSMLDRTRFRKSAQARKPSSPQK